MKTSALRLKPGSDVWRELVQIGSQGDLKAGAVVSLVGSLTQAAIRFADAPNATILQGPFEIVSATGTVSATGIHVHVSISDKAGTVLGGHLCEGSSVYTTAEVVVVDLSDEWNFERVEDSDTGYLELKVSARSES